MRRPSCLGTVKKIKDATETALMDTPTKCLQSADVFLKWESLLYLLDINWLVGGVANENARAYFQGFKEAQAAMDRGGWTPSK